MVEIETMKANPSSVMRHLRKLVPNLGDKSLEIIASRFEWQGFFQEGHPIISQFGTGDAMYIIDAGRVTVTRNTIRIGYHTHVADLVEGDIFGEMALILDQPRNANVIALESTAVFRLSIDDYRFIAANYPRIDLKFRQIALEREPNPSQLEPV